MPPNVPRKRLRDDSPSEKTTRASKRQQVKTPPKESTPNRRKATLYDDLDATGATSAQNGKSFLDSIDDSDADSPLSDLSDVDFEDVPLAHEQSGNALESEDDEDDDIDFEDVPAPQRPVAEAPAPTGDLELTLHRDTRISLTNLFGNKKGPSKVERKIRNATHCLHVQSLLWHNAVRNAWLCDPEVQAIMMSHVPPRIFDEVDRWRKASGLDVEPKPAEKPKEKLEAKGKGRPTRGRKTEEASGRDWSAGADRLEKGAVDMSHGDPLFRLIRALTSWWKQRFSITAPGLRKLGYMPLERLDRLTKAWAKEEHDIDLHGERIRNLDEFRQCATDCAGSRDVGAQLFTALLRALGLEARMVASLQPLGYGWTKAEEANPEQDTSVLGNIQRKKATDAGASESMDSAFTSKPSTTPGTPTKKTASARALRDMTKKSKLVKKATDSTKLELEYPDSDDESVIEIDAPKKSVQKKFDQDLEFPHYWTEVLSPATKAYLPVDAIVKKVVATNRELVESLEPRGGKADKARQVMTYIVGHCQDGTAKDVTVRYLKRQMLPGRTKGMRMPIEKVPIYNRHGKVKRYDAFDWFKGVMRSYARGSRKRPITEIDEIEDSTDLKPAQPEKKEVKDGEETLQYYKQSKEFCLERHLKREEALLPGAKPVKTFKNKGKGKTGEPGEEPVFVRKDVVNVKSAETWHKQGRAPLPGEQPLKRVPYRAATTNRRREIAEAEAISGEKVLQGLYSFDQTDWIIPPPIKDGIIPKNEYGNIDLFAEHMCPEGAVHVPFRGTVKVCKRLQIDYAEAVVDFEFGHRMAVPVIQGVVIAEEYHDQVMEELRKDEAERARKEDEKRRKEALRRWSKFIKGLRIVERIRQDYGHIDDSVVDVFHMGGGHHDHKSKDGDASQAAELDGHDEDMAGGFLPEGYVEEGPKSPAKTKHDAPRTTSSFFPDLDEDEDHPDDLEVDYGEHDRQNQESESKQEDDTGVDEGSLEGDNEEDDISYLPAPVKAKPRPKRKATKQHSPRRRRRKVVSDSDEDEDMDDDDEY